MWTVFPYLAKVFEKQKHSLDTLLETFNAFLVFGKEMFVTNPALIETVVQVAKTALFTQNPNTVINNSEGALLLQLVFQILKGSDALNNGFEMILDFTFERMQSTPIDNILKKHLLGIFMSAMSYNADATLIYLERKQATQNLVNEMFANKGKFKHSYEMKLFVIGLSEMLLSDNLPASLRPSFVKLFEEIIDMLASEEKSEKKQQAQKAKKEVRAVESSDDSDDSNWDDSDDEDQEEIEDDELGFKANDEEKKDEQEIDVSDKANSG